MRTGTDRGWARPQDPNDELPMHGTHCAPLLRAGASNPGALGVWCILRGMSSRLPTIESDDDAASLVEELVSILGQAHVVWREPDERRRMRFFGFRPAVEPNVLKREWHGTTVRSSPDSLRAMSPELGELIYLGADRTLRHDGRAFVPDANGMNLAQSLLDLILAYERWVEAREGKDQRISRGRVGDRTVNPLAATRRFQRALQVRRRGGR